MKEWDWSKLTAQAVAARAKVSERTVYRHFPTERALQEAILRRLEEEAGVTYEDIEPYELVKVTERIYSSLPKFAASVHADASSISASSHRRHKALLRILCELGADWSDTERRMAASIIDIVWTPNFYEHLVSRWHFDSPTASRTAVWTVELLMQAMRDGARPGPPRKSRRPARR